MIKVGDWIRYPARDVPWFTEINAQVIDIVNVELDRTLRHPFIKRIDQKLVCVSEHGNYFTYLASEVIRIPTYEEKLGEDYA